MKIDRPRLRNTLRKLRALPIGDNPTDRLMAPQEMLDLLACAAGIKPVCILGRGFAPPGWIDGAAKIAGEVGLHYFKAPTWVDDDFPWEVSDALDPHQKRLADVVYISRTTAIRGQLVEVQAAGGKLTVEQEAHFTGYPLCCVTEHHHRTRLMREAFFMMFIRMAGGNKEQAIRLMLDDVAVSPETPQEVEMFEQANELNMAPFTSVNMCRSCASDDRSPAWELSRKYRNLCLEIDPLLAREIEEPNWHISQKFE